MASLCPGMDSSTEHLMPGTPSPWASIYISSWLSFVCSVQYTLFLNTIWPHMVVLDPAISANFYSLTVFAYSFGQIVASPLLGWWSNRARTVKPPLHCGFGLMLTANLLYVFIEALPIPKRVVLLMFRFLLGLGSGNISLLRTYAATCPLPQDKARSIAYAACGNALGMSLGPAFQVIFTKLDYPGLDLGVAHLNLFTAPAYLACLVNVGGIVWLQTGFEETYAVSLIEDNDHVVVERVSDYDHRAIMVCYISRFVDKFLRTSLETLGPPFVMMMFSFDKVEAVRYPSIVHGLVGAITLLMYVMLITVNIHQHVKWRTSCILSLAAMGLFYLLTYPFAFLPDRVQLSTDNSGVGCDPTKYSWCSDLTAVNVWLYYVSYVVLIGASFPILTISLSTLFSDILGPRRQGAQQGWLQVSSSLGRMLGAVFVGPLYVSGGPRPVWQMQISVIGALLAAWFLFFNRMVSYRPNKV